MTEWIRDNDKNSGVLRIVLPLTVANVADLKVGILNAFAEAEQVALDVSAVHEVDVAGLQLLLASHLYAVARQKELSLILGDNRDFHHFVEEAGLAGGAFGRLFD